MAKTSSKGATAKVSKKDSKKVAPPVKEGRVTKPAQTPKAKSKEMAKSIAAKEVKKSKKTKKEPTPEPESDSASESESESESEASASESDSDSESSASESEVKVKAPVKANGTTKKAAAADSSSSESESEDSESESESDEEAAAPSKANGVKVNGAPKPAAKDESESDSDSSGSDSSESESDEEEEKPAAKTAAKAESTSDEDSASDSASDSADSDSSDSESESEEEEAPSKKRKADTEAEPATKKTKTEGGEEGIKNLFVGNLSWNVDEEWLAREFEQFGEITGCRIITDRETGRAKGFGYVEFASSESAAKAKEEMHQFELDGRPMNVDFSTPRANNQNTANKQNERAKRFGDKQSAPNNTLFIGNLSFDATNDSIHEVFSAYGEISRVSLPTDRDTGNPKGFGYVDFNTVDEAKAALEALHGTDVDGRPIRIDYATPRDDNGGGRGGRGGGRGGFDRGGRGGRGGFGGRGGGRGGNRGGFGGGRGGRGGSTNRGGFGDFKGSKVTF